MKQSISIVVEGMTDEAVVVRLVREAGLEPGPIYVTRGKDRLDRSLAGYNEAARFAPWLVVRDLDHDAACARALVLELLPRPAPGLLLRVAVRSIESWLLADTASMAAFLAVPVKRLPRAPDSELNPKQVMVNLARSSRRKEIRENLVPVEGTSARVGPGYSGRIAEFATRTWRPKAARRHSESLNRCIAALQALARRR